MTKMLLSAVSLVALLATVASAGTAMVINEVLYDPHPDQPGVTPNGDANGDGVRDGSEDEFVEIYNDEALAVDISGWKINDAVGNRHVFPAGSVVSPGCVIVVFGGGTPTGSFGNAVVQTASTGFLGLNNGGDTVSLLTAADVLIAELIYDGTVQDESLTRNPDVTGAFEGHSAASGDPNSVHSPGTQVDGTDFAGCGTVSVESSNWGQVKSTYR